MALMQTPKEIQESLTILVELIVVMNLMDGIMGNYKSSNSKLNLTRSIKVI